MEKYLYVRMYDIYFLQLPNTTFVYVSQNLGKKYYNDNMRCALIITESGYNL